jgi:hypothetical protein
MFLPFAARNVFAIAPPMTSVVTRSRSDSTTAILSDTFAPPRIAMYGFSGAVTMVPSAAISFSRRNPQPRSRYSFARPWTLACARCTAPNASSTYTSASVASSRQKSSSSFSSSSWKRRFSSRHTCPARRSYTTFFAASPMQSSGSVTSCPRSSARRIAHGSRERRGSGPFFGRPRWLAQTTRAPRAMACWMVGSASRMRESSVMRMAAAPPPSRGTLKSTRMKTRFCSMGRSLIERMPWRAVGAAT